MEQAEQLFSGAASADYVIKPILILYGFSQACRAMAASSSALDHQTFRYPSSAAILCTAPHTGPLVGALLFALSMRARYDPEGWTRDLAVRLETMLDMSMRICPELLVETMPSICHSPQTSSAVCLSAIKIICWSVSRPSLVENWWITTGMMGSTLPSQDRFAGYPA